MPRLSNHAQFGKRNYEAESETPKKVYAIAYEGNITEKNYFHGVKDNKESLKISDCIEVIPLDRADDDTKSHAKYVIEILDEYSTEFGIDSDEVWMVIDRDIQNNPRENLNELIENAHDKGYKVALVNPAFEFWLLLHIADLDLYDQEELLLNEKGSSKKRRFIDKELSNLLYGFNKKSSIAPFMNRKKIEKAIEQEKNVCQSFPDILDHLGSNVGILMAKILNV